MRILAIDTCTTICATAILLDDGRCLAATQDMVRGHAEVLPTMIADLLDQGALAYRDLDRIVVTIGPGSFTGIRIGLSTARGLALVLEKLVVGVSTLKALAYAALDRRGHPVGVYSVLDARRGELYGQGFAPSGQAISQPLVAPVADICADFHDLFPNAAHPPLLVGSGADSVLQHLRDAARIELMPDLSWPPIQSILEFGSQLSAAEAPAKPLYLRSPDARPLAIASLVARV